MLNIEAKGPGVVALTGRLDAAESARAQAALDAVDAVDGIVNLDCTGLEYISSAGLGVLLKTQKRLLAANSKLRLTSVSRHLQDIFRYSGFDQIIEIEPLR